MTNKIIENCVNANGIQSMELQLLAKIKMSIYLQQIMEWNDPKTVADILFKIVDMGKNSACLALPMIETLIEIRTNQYVKAELAEEKLLQFFDSPAYALEAAVSLWKISAPWEWVKTEGYSDYMKNKENEFGLNTLENFREKYKENTDEIARTAADYANYAINHFNRNTILTHLWKTIDDFVLGKKSVLNK